MTDIGTVLAAAQTLFAALECSILKEVCTALGYKSQLDDLKSTVETVKSVLLDAAASEELTHTARDYIQKLKTAVYDADDLFDEFRTVAERKQQLKEGKLFEKVRLFFSSENSLKVAYKMSREIKKIRKKLDGIARDHTNFGFTIDSKRIRNGREETWSYVNAPTVIGREADVKAIVDNLLDLNNYMGVRFLTVVGIGGMGKTTLAQLIYGDERVKKGFSKLWWVCVADQDNNPFDKKPILCKILDLATGSKHYDLSLEEIQMKLRRELEGIKYLLVLDDLWNDDKVKWMELKDFLVLGAPGSRIVVTSRSYDVAKAIGDSDIHVLKGLSDENSWRLFEMIAFQKKLDSQADPLEVEIGKKIVKQCSNVPLALKVVGSLLCGQSIDKWQTFEKSGLNGMCKGDNQIMSILKFSYHNLEPSLKSCFSYCAVFPKDFKIKKEMLIRLWMAHGYILPFNRYQSVEDANEEYLSIFLQRCFFQNVRTDKHGNVKSFKMHDLIHDVAQEVAGQEILIATSETSNLGSKVRHVFEGSCVREENFYTNVKFRSYLRVAHPEVDLRLPLGTLLTNGRFLRTLTLAKIGVKSLPESIGKLLHLRYLDLSGNIMLKTLPDSITKLHNLQTLKLESCLGLRELPKNICRLVNLMHLDMKNCFNIKYMPVGMDKLTSLVELTHFVVADESSNGMKQVGQLKDLKALVNLKGCLDIVMHQNVNRAVLFGREGCFLEGAQHLKMVRIKFPHDCLGDADDEALLEKLLPHPNVIELQLWYYRGVKVPSWGKADYSLETLLPNLVTINITSCHMLKHLPLLSTLKNLQSLILSNLPELEYIENTGSTNSYASAGCTLFPSLESLVIINAPKLKGLWAGVEFADSSSNARLWQRSFPRLSELKINCLKLFDTELRAEKEFWVELGRVNYLKSLPAGRLSKITFCDEEMKSLEEVGDILKNCSSLRGLRFHNCSKLSHISGGLEQLTTLESLEIEECGNLKWKEGDNDGLPWRHLHRNLRSLKIKSINNMEALPQGMQFLSALENLTIQRCDNLEALPKWISCLSSLQSFSVISCKKIKSIPEAMRNTTSLSRFFLYFCSNEVKGRCQKPDGEDWPKIQHISNIIIR